MSSSKNYKKRIRDVKEINMDIKIYSNEVDPNYISVPEYDTGELNEAPEDFRKFYNKIRTSVFQKIRSKQFSIMNMEKLKSMNEYELTDCFQFYDEDGSKTLDRKEILKMSLKMGLNVSEANDLFDNIDVNGDGSISQKEWVEFFLLSKNYYYKESSSDLTSEFIIQSNNNNDVYINNNDLSPKALNNLYENYIHNEFDNNNNSYFSHDINNVKHENFEAYNLNEKSTGISLGDKNSGFIYNSNYNNIYHEYIHNGTQELKCQKNTEKIQKQSNDEIDEIDKYLSEGLLNLNLGKFNYDIVTDTGLSSIKIKKTIKTNTQKLYSELKKNKNDYDIFTDQSRLKYSSSPSRIRRRSSIFSSIAYNVL